MEQKHILSRIGLLSISLLLVLALLAVAIPQKTQAATEDTGSFTASIQNGKIVVSLSGFTNKHVMLVKVRDATQGVGGWKNLGKLKIAKNASLSKNFAIPKSLATTMYLNVCVKDQSTDTLTCKAVLNPNGRLIP